MIKKCLTIAGSDSSGGAGVQADLKTFSALGTYGMSCICALTAQNTQGVDKVENVSQAMIRGQLAAIYSDIVPDAVKTGMLSCRGTVETVAGFLESHNQAPLVVDPVMVATTGARLLDEEAIISYKERLIPLATLVTPNIPEAEVLSGMAIHTEEDMKQAAEKIMGMGPKAVLIKGGHKVHDATDFLYDGETFHVFRGEKNRYGKYSWHRMHLIQCAGGISGPGLFCGQGCSSGKKISYRSYSESRCGKSGTWAWTGIPFLVLWK